jgi:DNA-binding transcriptional LysR family regulator
MLELHELNVFIQAVETLSFTAAAERLRISQPAVSMQISNLEKRLDTPLFDRSGRSVRPTEAAKVLLPLAREIVNLSANAEETMASLHGRLQGHLQIACTTSAGKYVLPHLIARFRQMHSEVRVTVDMPTAELAVEQVCDGRSQIGILSREVVHRDVEYRHFFSDRVVLIVRPDHPWARRPSIKPHELLGEPFILREELSGTRRTMQAGLLEHGVRLQDLNVVMELGNAEAIESSVEAGIGVAFLSWLVVQHHLDVGCLAEVKVEGLDLQRELYVIRHARRAPTRVQEAFWDFIHTVENRELLQATA